MNASIAGVLTTSCEWRNRASRSIMRASLDSVDRMQASTKRASRTLSSCCAAATDAADGATADAELRCRPVCERGATVESVRRANDLGRRATDRRVEDALAEAGRAGELLRDAHRVAAELLREVAPQRRALGQLEQAGVEELDDARRELRLLDGPLAYALRRLRRRRRARRRSAPLRVVAPSSLALAFLAFFGGGSSPAAGTGAAGAGAAGAGAAGAGAAATGAGAGGGEVASAGGDASMSLRQ